jgi:hypothetical protein
VSQQRRKSLSDNFSQDFSHRRALTTAAMLQHVLLLSLLLVTILSVAIAGTEAATKMWSEGVQKGAVTSSTTRRADGAVRFFLFGWWRPWRRLCGF